MAAQVLKGFSFPFRKGASTFPEVATTSDIIRQSIIQLLGTVRGERQYRPDYGVDFISKIFEGNSATLADAIRYETLYAIAKFETRVVVKSVSVVRDVDQGLLTVEVQYQEIATKQLQSLPITFDLPAGG